jgi:hypothetical protein
MIATNCSKMESTAHFLASAIKSLGLVEKEQFGEFGFGLIFSGELGLWGRSDCRCAVLQDGGPPCKECMHSIRRLK